jgi:hypothetical protein
MQLDTNKHRQRVGLIIIVGGFSLLTALIFFAIPEANKDILNISIGIALGWVGSVIGYEFGSSQGERKAAARGMAEPVPVTVENTETNPVPVEPSQ